jgi:hypothetical protein
MPASFAPLPILWVLLRGFNHCKSRPYLPEVFLV